jgi:hypothetical protein
LFSLDANTTQESFKTMAEGWRAKIAARITQVLAAPKTK